MKLYYYSAVRVGSTSWVDRLIQAHQLLVDWDEVQATKVKRLTSTNWNADWGDISGGIDADSNMESNALIKTGETGTWKSWNLTNVTQDWVDGSATNYGVILWATNEDTDGYDLRFYSSEAASNKPKLEVTYSTAQKTVYFLKDHLGSIRATVLDSATVPVVGYDDYDPWGYILADRSSATAWSGGQNIAKNKFTGKEWDDDFGLDWYHLGARPYDPETGRFPKIDRFADKYPSLTPYHYAANNPILFIDINGDSIDVSQLSKDDRTTLLGQLALLTGLPLAVNKAGKLIVVEGLSGPGKGSKTAREYLLALIAFQASEHQSGKHLTIKSGPKGNYSNAPDVNNIIEVPFAARNANNVYPLAFGPGTTFFHEAYHFSEHFKFGTSLFGQGGRDPVKDTASFKRGDTGPTVDFVNRIRRELGFKERASYQGLLSTQGINYVAFDQQAKSAIVRRVVPASNTSYFWWK